MLRSPSDLDPDLAEDLEHGRQRVGADPRHGDVAPRDRTRHQEGPRLDPVRDHAVLSAVKLGDPPDREPRRSDPLDPGPHRHETPRQVGHLRFTGGPLDHGLALFVLDNDAAHVALAHQFLDFGHQLLAGRLDLFCKCFFLAHSFSPP